MVFTTLTTILVIFVFGKSMIGCLVSLSTNNCCILSVWLGYNSRRMGCSHKYLRSFLLLNDSVARVFVVLTRNTLNHSLNRKIVSIVCRLKNVSWLLMNWWLLLNSSYTNHSFFLRGRKFTSLFMLV